MYLPTFKRMEHYGYLIKRLRAVYYYVCLPFLHRLFCHSIFSSKIQRKNCNRRNTSERISEENRQAILMKRERDITRAMAVVLGAFILCWAPSSIYYFLHMVCPQCYQPSFKQVEPVFNAVMKLLTFLNSCLNPFIYCWSNEHFRQAFWKRH